MKHTISPSNTSVCSKCEQDLLQRHTTECPGQPAHEVSVTLIKAGLLDYVDSTWINMGNAQNAPGKPAENVNIAAHSQYIADALKGIFRVTNPTAHLAELAVVTRKAIHALGADDFRTAVLHAVSDAPLSVYDGSSVLTQLCYLQADLQTVNQVRQYFDTPYDIVEHLGKLIDSEPESAAVVAGLMLMWSSRDYVNILMNMAAEYARNVASGKSNSHIQAIANSLTTSGTPLDARATHQAMRLHYAELTKNDPAKMIKASAMLLSNLYLNTCAETMEHLSAVGVTLTDFGMSVDQKYTVIDEAIKQANITDTPVHSLRQFTAYAFDLIKDEDILDHSMENLVNILVKGKYTQVVSTAAATLAAYVTDDVEPIVKLLEFIHQGGEEVKMLKVPSIVAHDFLAMIVSCDAISLGDDLTDVEIVIDIGADSKHIHDDLEKRIKLQQDAGLVIRTTNGVRITEGGAQVFMALSQNPEVLREITKRNTVH